MAKIVCVLYDGSSSAEVGCQSNLQSLIGYTCDDIQQAPWRLRTISTSVDKSCQKGER